MLPRVARLSSRELDVACELLADGASNRAIGERLGMSEGTVKTHVKRVLRASGCHSRTELVAKVLHGLIVLGPQ